VRAFTHDSLPFRVVFGVGAARTRLAEEVAALGLERLLLVSGDHERDAAQRLAEPLGARVTASFAGVRPHVPVEVAERARATAREGAADGLLCVGGGSAIGTAKAVALELALPIVALPTTYSGSEMTPIFGLSRDGRKETGRSPRVLPRLVVYDPELTRSLPPAVTGASAMNAVAHCVEALYAPGSSPVTALLALDGARALARAAPAAVERPGDLEARAEALYGAFLAGAAFASAGTGLHHRICHVLGGAYDLPHAETHAAVLPHVVTFFEAARPDLFAPLARALASPSAAGGLYELARRLRTPSGLGDLGLAREQLGEAARLCREAVPAENPRPVGDADLAAILEAAQAGAPPAPNPPRVRSRRSRRRSARP
jgi:maleylacetate reductase